MQIFVRKKISDEFIQKQNMTIPITNIAKYIATYIHDVIKNVKSTEITGDFLIKRKLDLTKIENINDLLVKPIFNNIDTPFLLDTKIEIISGETYHFYKIDINNSDLRAHIYYEDPYFEDTYSFSTLLEMTNSELRRWYVNNFCWSHTDEDT